MKCECGRRTWTDSEREVAFGVADPRYTARMTEEVIQPAGGQSSDLRFVNRVLAGLAILSTGWSIYGTFSNVNRFRSLENVFRGVKIPLPGLALLALEYQQALAAVLFTVCASCLYETYRRPEQRRTSYLNMIGILLPLLWWILQTTTFFLTCTALVEMFGAASRNGR